MQALSHKHSESQALTLGPRFFLSPFVVIWTLSLMHWHRLHHKWHHRRSSGNKHGLPKCSALSSREATLSHERAPRWNVPLVPLTAPVWRRRCLSLPYWVISLGLSAAVTAPAVIEFGLFSLQTLTPDFIEGDGIWKMGDTGRQTLFLYIRWCTELESLMWEMPARPCSSVLLLLPFLSPPEDTMLWLFESLSALLSWRLKLESYIYAGSEGVILGAV